MNECYRLLDCNGNDIPHDCITTGVTPDRKMLKIILKDDFNVFCTDEIDLMINLISDRINQGTTPLLARYYLDIMDKLEKIRERK